MSVLTLPEPTNWPDIRRRLTKLTLIVGVFVAMGTFTGVREFLLGNVFEGVVSFGFVVTFVLPVVALQLGARRHTVLRAGHDGTGTVLRPDRVLTLLLLGMAVFFMLFATIFVAFTVTGHLHLFTRLHGQTAAVVGMSLAAGTALTGLLTAWRRGGMGYVKLTPTGIDVADVKNTESVAWDDVVGVDDHSEVNTKTGRAVVLRRRDGTEKIIDGCDLYVPNGVGLYWMVWHYWRHPDDRPELTDGRALARLGEGRFDTSVM